MAKKLISPTAEANQATYYKFLREQGSKIVSEHGEQVWEVGATYSVTGKVKACQNGFHASVEPLDALSYVKGEILAIVEGSGECGEKSDKVCYRSMSIVKAYRWTVKDSIALAIYAAEQVLKIYEYQYPNDARPRDAIAAAKAYLNDASEQNLAAARAAARAAAEAARAAAEAARAAAYAAYAAYEAARAARAARAAAEAALKAKVNAWIKDRLPVLKEVQ